MMWHHVAIADFCQTGSGGTPSRNNRGDYYGGRIPWVKSGELQDKPLSITEEFITEMGLKKSSAKLVPPGAILIAMYGATVGRTALLEIEATTNQAVCFLLPDKRIANNCYVWYAMRARYDELLAKRTGGAQPNISQQIIKTIRIPLPPPSEQSRIVELLNEADNLRRLQREADSKAARILLSLFRKMFGDPATNPMLWPIKPLEDYVASISRENPSSSPEDYFRYIDIASIDGEKGRIAVTKQLLGRDAPGRARQIVRWRDTLISTVRPYLRATALVPVDLDGEIASTGFCVLRPKQPSGYAWLYQLTRQQWFTEQLNIRARGASYPAVTDVDILRLEVPVPNDSSRLRQFDADFEKVTSILKAAEKGDEQVDILFNVLLQRAFNGQLTAKWREDHMKELITEMEYQTKLLNFSDPSIEKRVAEA